MTKDLTSGGMKIYFLLIAILTIPMVIGHYIDAASASDTPVIAASSSH